MTNGPIASEWLLKVEDKLVAFSWALTTDSLLYAGGVTFLPALGDSRSDLLSWPL